MLSGGKHAARKLKRAQILLAADAGASDEDDRAQPSRSAARRCIGPSAASWKATWSRRSARSRVRARRASCRARRRRCWWRPPAPARPQGRKRWTLELLAGEMVRLTEHDGLSRETVRRRLAENELKPWRRDMWCIPQVDGSYVARMEDVLDLYAEAADPQAAGGVLRREPDAADRRGAPADPGRAGPAGALRLRVSPQRHGQSVRVPRCAPAVAAGEGHRAAHRAGLRRTACAIWSTSHYPRPS